MLGSIWSNIGSFNETCIDKSGRCLVPTEVHADFSVKAQPVKTPSHFILPRPPFLARLKLPTEVQKSLSMTHGSCTLLASMRRIWLGNVYLGNCQPVLIFGEPGPVKGSTMGS